MLKNILKTGFFTSTSLLTSFVFAADPNVGILGGANKSTNAIREGNISFNDIPVMIGWASNYLLGFAGTIAIVMIIYGAFQRSLFSITSDDKTKSTDTIKHGIYGFVLASCAWLIVRVIVANL